MLFLLILNTITFNCHTFGVKKLQLKIKINVKKCLVVIGFALFASFDMKPYLSLYIYIFEGISRMVRGKRHDQQGCQVQII